MVHWWLMGGVGAQHDKPSLVVIVRSGPINLDPLSCNSGNLPLYFSMHLSIAGFNFYHISDTSKCSQAFELLVSSSLKAFSIAGLYYDTFNLNIRCRRSKNKNKNHSC